MCRSRELEGDRDGEREQAETPSCSLISFAEFNHGATKNKVSRRVTLLTLGVVWLCDSRCFSSVRLLRKCLRGSWCRSAGCLGTKQLQYWNAMTLLTGNVSLSGVISLSFAGYHRSDLRWNHVKQRTCRNVTYTIWPQHWRKMSGILSLL